MRWIPRHPGPPRKVRYLHPKQRFVSGVFPRGEFEQLPRFSKHRYRFSPTLGRGKHFAPWICLGWKWSNVDEAYMFSVFKWVGEKKHQLVVVYVFTPWKINMKPKVVGVWLRLTWGEVVSSFCFDEVNILGNTILGNDLGMLLSLHLWRLWAEKMINRKKGAYIKGHGITIYWVFPKIVVPPNHPF